ncbi:MAG: hypothetical protein HUJ66_08710 [Oscillospiraceae bacterium]|nr:hypothetical protein [Oscillospiraceae bacterium]
MNCKTAKRLTGGGGIILLAALFVLWQTEEKPSPAGLSAALVSACLFAFLCLRFISPCFDFLGAGSAAAAAKKSEKGELREIFVAALLWDVILVLAVTLVRAMAGADIGLDFWRCTDSRHYLDIAADWYLSEGSIDRLVQLVFLPGYPLAVRAVRLFVRSYVLAGMLVSALCFAGSACLLYRLLRLDMTREKALRAVVFFCIMPSSFFFAAPMSESLFMLLSLSCVYLSRRGKFIPAAVFGALACFTRSVGLALLVPLLFEFIAQRRRIRDYLALLIVPLGFAVYCYVNYAVAGDPFKFMEYQQSHWNQSFGLFFSTAAYQTDNALAALGTDSVNFFGLWLPNLLSQLFALSLMCFGAGKLRPSYTAYFAAYFFVAIGATWLLSAPRYMLVMFPLCIALSELGERKAPRYAAYALCVLLGTAYLMLFALRWQVW